MSPSPYLRFEYLRQIRTDKTLPPTAFLIAFDICDHFLAEGEAFMSQATLAEVSCFTDRTVRTMLAKLVDRRHLSVERFQGWTNRYRPFLHPETRNRIAKGMESKKFTAESRAELTAALDHWSKDPGTQLPGSPEPAFLQCLITEVSPCKSN